MNSQVGPGTRCMFCGGEYGEHSDSCSPRQPTEKQVGGDHYKKMAIQPAVFVHTNGIGFMEGSAIAYLCRHKSKGKADDIRKAIHFMRMLLELEYGEKE